MMFKRLAVLILCMGLAGPGLALTPSEVIGDPVLDERARHLDEQLRCVKCQSENLASSNADWAKDARMIIREQLVEGRSDAEIIAFFEERYGDFVLMKPKMNVQNLVLWAAGPLLLLFGGGLAFSFIRRREGAGDPGPADLTEDEHKRLDALLTGATKD